MGALVLLLTLFATQYSGNSLSGFPGQTYREGLAYYMSVTFMVAIVTGYLLFAPRLYRLSRTHQFLTPSDYLRSRFDSRWLALSASVILTITMINFLLAQLIAMGHTFAGLTDGRVPYWVGVVGGAAVILVYELLGGMRAVAWTDALQGMILMLGLLLAAVFLAHEIGSPAEVLDLVAAVAPEKLATPTWEVCVLWISNMLLLGLGGPLYPQAIQRIYAARKAADLKRALTTMAFLPHLAITTVVFIGIAGIALFPSLDRIESDQITFKVLAFLVEQQPLAFLPVLVIMMGVLAAIMSTADSCLLSLSSIVTKDFVARSRRHVSTDAESLTAVGTVSSIVAMLVLVPLALARPATLWGLLVIKFEILIQLSPCFVLGTLHERGQSRAFAASDMLAGLLTGLATALFLYATDLRPLPGLHAGSAGVFLNYAAVLLAREVRLRRRSVTESGPPVSV